ncbi:CLUMA_CG020101, isoform A [Clunio marinus]|uniref:CLUMA_CG020101, isoform A n=1 Tax=Clunio marinus TaxID=568069 RepID=A0A1J1J3X7_9DIPT|nr:CLUMA_CG020101, isoform A [Clunio marinus]
MTSRLTKELIDFHNCIICSKLVRFQFGIKIYLMAIIYIS